MLKAMLLFYQVSACKKIKNKNEGNNNKDKLGKLRMQATVQTSVINHRLADTGERDIPTVSPRGRYFVCSFIIIFFFFWWGKEIESFRGG